MSTSYPSLPILSRTNIYEVNIRQYTPEGTFEAFRKHLPRLQKMGVKILWLMPITPISTEERQGTLGSYYACNSYTKINHEFGTEDDFSALVKDAHAKGMMVIIDWVANHTGYGHEWTLNHPDWFERDENGKFIEKHGWKDVIDLNYDNTDMQNAMIAAMQYWIKTFDIDGFRCDMAHLVRLDFWHKARKSCDRLKPLFWLAECDEDNYSEVFDVSYAWRWMHATEEVVKNKGHFDNAWNILQHYLSLPKGANKLFFTSNHDENSWTGTEYEKYGNVALSLAVLHTFLPVVPLIYSGQELPLKKRLKFFDKDLIAWTNTPALEYFYEKLLQVRNSHPTFDDNATVHVQQHQDAAVSVTRTKGEYKLITICNITSHQVAKVFLNQENLAGRYKSLFSNITYSFKENDTFELYPGDYLVYIKCEE